MLNDPTKSLTLGDFRGVANRDGPLGSTLLKREGKIKEIIDPKETVYGQYKDKSSTYLVDPASGHMLVSKIKPCMSMHKPINGEAANGSLQQPLFT